MLLCVAEVIAARGDAAVFHNIATTAVHAARAKHDQLYAILLPAGVHIDAGAFFAAAREKAPRTRLSSAGVRVKLLICSAI